MGEPDLVYEAWGPVYVVCPGLAGDGDLGLLLWVVQPILSLIFLY